MAEIVSLCILAPDGRVLLDSLVKPMQEITNEASQVNGLSDAMLEDAPDFRDLLAQVQAILIGKAIVAYNAEFDQRMLYQTCRMRGLPADWLLAADWQCAMNAYAAWFGEWRDDYGTYRWQRLPGGDHTAAGDCQATLALIRHMAHANREKQ